MVAQASSVLQTRPVPPPRPVRVALVDDHPYLREGVTAILDRYHDVEVVAAVGSVDDLAAHTGAPPDVVVLDLHLSAGPTGAPAVSAVRELGYPVLVLTAETDPARLLAAIRAGALGLLHKSGEVAALRAAIRATASGETLVTPAMASRMEAESRSSSRLTFPPALAEVLRLLAHGLDNRTIARRRCVSVSTVKKQVREIRDIYAGAGVDVSDRADLRDAARRTFPEDWRE